MTIVTLSVMAWWRLSGPAMAQSSCTLQLATSPLAFCDTFDAPAGTGNRSGDLNGKIWGVSRILGDTNYPKQPFDFAGRTGTIGFDVSNDSHGTHSAWPELWVTDEPQPAPFNHFDSWIALPQHGFGVRFAAQVGPGQYGFCPNADNTTRWTVDSAVVFRDYVYEDTNGFGTKGSHQEGPRPHRAA